MSRFLVIRAGLEGALFLFLMLGSVAANESGTASSGPCQQLLGRVLERMGQPPEQLQTQRPYFHWLRSVDGVEIYFFYDVHFGTDNNNNAEHIRIAVVGPNLGEGDHVKILLLMLAEFGTQPFVNNWIDLAHSEGGIFVTDIAAQTLSAATQGHPWRQEVCVRVTGQDGNDRFLHDPISRTNNFQMDLLRVAQSQKSVTPGQLSN